MSTNMIINSETTSSVRRVKPLKISIDFDDCDYRNVTTAVLMGTHPQVFQIHPREPMNAHREDCFDASGDARALEKNG